MSDARPSLLEQRRAGVLLHISSLPSRFGAGDMGHEAHRFVEFLSEAGFSVWQVLPLGPTHADLSPYNALSVHAGNPLLISLDWLHDRGWLELAELAALERREITRQQALAGAAVRFEASLSDLALAEDFRRFRERNADWLEDYALFCALRDARNGAPWYQWERALREREDAALTRARAECAARVSSVCFEQYVFERQWRELRAYAVARGLYFYGDVPIFVAHDSAEVWAHRELFWLDIQGMPTVVTGVPPDYFSAEGQLWGNPHYDWSRMREDGFAWWRRRMATQMARFDLLRIDHFRGFEACWEVSRSARNAVEGRWVPAPGAQLLTVLIRECGPGTLVAENLGIITPAVERLRRHFDLPGMVVLQFGFDGVASNPHLPHNHTAWSVVYSGTHDNDTTLGWYDSLGSGTRTAVDTYLGHCAEAMPWPLLRAAVASVARLAILPLQDVLALGSEHRMNIPGLATGNWRWQCELAPLDEALAARMRGLLGIYGRLA